LAALPVIITLATATGAGANGRHRGRVLRQISTARQAPVTAIDRYLEIYRSGCTPPGSAAWGYTDNNKTFYDQASS
jgi:hypothetical protein